MRRDTAEDIKDRHSLGFGSGARQVETSRNEGTAEREGGPFSWAGLADASAYKAVMESLHQFETMQESAIRAQGSHPVEIENSSKVAQDRLCAIELDDLDELMSFRLGGKTRVWCRMDRNVMLVLWWDPEHQVCPSMKIHT
jgi:hypothetical protein